LGRLAKFCNPPDTDRIVSPAARPLEGHQDRFRPPRLSARCRLTQGTFAGTHGNGRQVPFPAVRGAAIEPLESGRVSDAGPGASNRPGTGGQRRKASDEGTRGKAASSWPSMGIWCGSRFGGGWSSQDCWIPTGAEDCGSGAAALDGLTENSSVASFGRLQGPGRKERAAGNEMFRRMNAAWTR